MKHIKRLEITEKGMENFCRTKKNIFLPCKDGGKLGRFVIVSSEKSS